jgi:ABC-type glycerol-3-phosphate transport system permease component
LNGYFNALIYLSKQQLLSAELIIVATFAGIRTLASNAEGDPHAAQAALRLAETMKYGIIIVCSVPMLILYPFVQRFFVKGVMIGSIKG